jgi:LacI family transcriptional regulator
VGIRVNEQDTHRAPTIYDVAERAGVAASTVSRAFARPGRVNSETAEKIHRAAEEIGYRVTPPSRPPSTHRTSMIALAIADVTNPFHAEIIRGAQTTAAAAGYTVLLADAQESNQVEREALERTIPTVEGVVLASSRMSDSAIRMIAKQRPTVVLNRGIPDVPCLVTDNARGVRRSVEHLTEHGHDAITFLGGPEASWANGARWRALRETTLELEVHARRVGPFPPTVAGGEEAATAWAKRPSTAVLAYNDQMAIGFIRWVRQHGMRVPDDVSVIGFDNIWAAELVSPPLTTVAAPLRLMGETAVRTVLAQIGGVRPRAAGPVTLPVTLVVRRSTGPLRRRDRSHAPAHVEDRSGPERR